MSKILHNSVSDELGVKIFKKNIDRVVQNRTFVNSYNFLNCQNKK